ncbi:MAG: sodium:calcium antiporter [Planctomycetaceae bacterium]|nr:sodium:calcium antiporter [Planctomycetaceae bacterium]
MEALIPPEWFAEKHPAILAVIAAVAMYALMKGADWLVDGASDLAYGLGVPKVIVGATIVSLGTTAPECAVSVMAAWKGNAGLALGNAVGSIIADTGLIFGLGCALVVLPADPQILSRQGWVQFGSAVLLAALCYASFAIDGEAAALGREVGGLFLVLLALYMIISMKWSQSAATAEAHAKADEAAEGSSEEGGASEERADVVKCLMMIVFGAAVVVFSSYMLIESVSEIARQFGVPKVVIAGTVVAFGTSLPELMVAITSIRRGHFDLLVGNVVGADVLNVLFVIGASAVAAPLPIIDPEAKIPEVFLLLHLPAMLTILLMFRIFIFKASKTGKFSRWMGYPLLATYLAFLIGSLATTSDPDEKGHGASSNGSLDTRQHYVRAADSFER